MNMKLIMKIIKKVIVAFGIIYLMDLILNGKSIFIPINLATISVGTCLGIFGIVAMIIVFLTIQ
mgnify:CR=1 FL=1